MSFEEGKEFSYFLCRMKFKRRTRYFTNALVLLDRKSHPTGKNMRFTIKTYRSTKPSNVFITAMLKLENAMRLSGVPYHLFLNKRVIRLYSASHFR